MISLPWPLRGLFYRLAAGPRRVLFWLGWFWIVLALSGCASAVAVPLGQPPGQIDQSFLHASSPEPVLRLSEGQTVSQSFLSFRDGLDRVAVMMTHYGQPVQGEVIVTLLDDTGQAVFSERVPVDRIAQDQPRHFSFPPQLDSSGRAYTVQLVGASPAAAAPGPWQDDDERYPGQLMVNGQAVGGDLLLEWGYQSLPRLLLFHLGRVVAQHGVTLLLAILLWTLPGLALLLGLQQVEDAPCSLPRLLAGSVAVSGSILILLPQFTHLAGIRLGSWAVWALLGVSAIYLLWLLRQERLAHAARRPDGFDLFFLSLLALLLVTRLLAIHALDAPAFGDSVHHTLITRLLMEQGGLFENYEPYVPLASFTYHAGFHLLSAWFGWSVLPGASPLPATTAVLLNGQLLSVWAVVMVGYLADGLLATAGRENAGRLAGALALIVAGLWSPMPAYYTNWGRYTQLAGQLFLPAALLWSLAAWSPDRARRHLTPLVLVLAAMALTHYRVVIMYAIAAPFFLGPVLWQRRGTLPRFLPELAIRLLMTGALVGLLILPWYANLASGLLVRLLGATVQSAGLPSSFTEEYNALGDMNFFVPRWIQWATAAALVWLAARRRYAALFLGGWTVLLFVLANPYTFLRLSGTGLVNNFMIQIALYLPASALVAIAGADVAGWLAEQLRLPARRLGLAAAMLLLVLAVRAAWTQSEIVDAASFAMLTAKDQTAAAWIQENTPEEAVFHINGFPAFGGGIIAGSDGGWWLWTEARRETTIPPIIYGHEAGFVPDYQALITERYKRLMDAAGEPERLAATLRAEGIDYVYIGAQQGRVGLPPGVEPLDPLELSASPAFETLYSDDFVWIFRATP